MAGLTAPEAGAYGGRSPVSSGHSPFADLIANAQPHATP
jgi:hypothetical protein